MYRGLCSLALGGLRGAMLNERNAQVGRLSKNGVIVGNEVVRG